MAAAFASKVTLPAVPSMAGVAREHVGFILEGTPRADDARLIASELVTVPIAAGCAEFTISVEWQGCRARIEVHDIKPLSRHRETPVDGESGPGMGLASLLADEVGHALDGSRCGVRWAVLSWSDGDDRD